MRSPSMTVYAAKQVTKVVLTSRRHLLYLLPTLAAQGSPRELARNVANVRAENEHYLAIGVRGLCHLNKLSLGQVKSAYDCYLSMIVSTLGTSYKGPREWIAKGEHVWSWETTREGVRRLAPEGDHADALTWFVCT